MLVYPNVYFTIITKRIKNHPKIKIFKILNVANHHFLKMKWSSFNNGKSEDYLPVFSASASNEGVMPSMCCKKLIIIIRWPGK